MASNVCRERAAGSWGWSDETRIEGATGRVPFPVAAMVVVVEDVMGECVVKVCGGGPHAQLSARVKVCPGVCPNCPSNVCTVYVRTVPTESVRAEKCAAWEEKRDDSSLLSESFPLILGASI